MSYKWRIASQDDFHQIYSLIYNSEARPLWNLKEIKRRVIIPLILEQLIVFYDDNRKICGFLTFAFMNDQSAFHQASDGISAADWRSGHQLWLVDFLAAFGGVEEMFSKIRRDCRDAIDQPMRYVRFKRKRIERISLGEKI